MSKLGKIRVVSVSILCLLIAGCTTQRSTSTVIEKTAHKGGKRYHLDNDTAPHPKESVPDLSKIANAKPINEPKSKYGNPKSYKVFNKSYEVMDSSKGYKERGTASWYGKKFHGYRTSNGEIYDMYSMSAAHKTLPLPTYAKVTNLKNGKSVIVKINDRGPFHEDRIIDLSYAAASKLGVLNKGTADVEVEAIDLTTELTDLYLQVGAFSVEQNAKKLAAKIKQHAPEHEVIVRPNKSKNNRLFHVHIGPFIDETVVSKVKQTLSANKFPEPITVRIRQP